MEITQNKIAIVTDSCADLSKEQREQYNIHMLPLMVRCEDGEYRDSVDITADDIYERLKTEIPKTSTPSGETIEGMFEELKQMGYEKVIVIMISGGISGSVNHVRLAAEDSGMDVYVVNSLNGSIGHGVMAIQASIWREEGMEFEEICKKVDGLCKTTFVFFCIDTLEYLQKGGRIGKTTALVGTALNIKPILTFDEEGIICTAAKVRGRKLVEKKLLSLVGDLIHAPEHVGKRYNLMIADGGVREERDSLEIKIKEAFPEHVRLIPATVQGALGIYLGPGMVGAGVQFLED
ncbi:MAG: DegV family protein [Lachnospiraceae bacterium]|nr:DegV family protein [Lachnospiraceae bacterium]